jgi:hypothetical protein
MNQKNKKTKALDKDTDGECMNSFHRKMTKAVLTVAFFTLSAITVQADIEKFHGKAVNTDGKVIFFEEHTIRYTNNQIASMNTIYYDTNLNKIGEMVSDFSHGPQLGSYDLRDERLRYNDGARVTQDQILIYRKPTPEDDVRKKTLQREPGQIVGQGFHPFLINNLENLVKGDVISAKLVLPAQMDQFDVRIYKRYIAGSRVSVRIEMESWFLRLFAPHVDVDYDVNTRQLLAYRGVSVVADESGKSVPVTVSYDYTAESIQVSLRSAPPKNGPASN